MLQTKVVKKQFIADLDKNEAPTGFRFKVDRFVTFDDGSEKIIPDEIIATQQEIEAHFGQAVTAQAADIAADKVVRDDLVTQLSTKDVELVQKTTLLTEKDALIAARDLALTEKDAALATAIAEKAAVEAALATAALATPPEAVKP